METAEQDVVRQIINRWDPESLLAGGAPDDEYEFEIGKIVDGVLACKDELELMVVIKMTFSEAFGYEYPVDECLPVARSIWVKLSS